MVVTDLDETLLRTDKTISKYTIDILKSVRKQGIKIIFATARGDSTKVVNIRVLNENEIKAASEVTISCTGYSRGFIGQSEDVIREWLDTENSQLFVAEVDENIVGLCFVILYGFDSEKGTILWIRELVVNPNHQSNGIGRQMIVHGINWGVENGAKRSFLACDAENYKAIKLYEKLGYRKKDGRGQINMELII